VQPCLIGKRDGSFEGTWVLLDRADERLCHELRAFLGLATDDRSHFFRKVSSFLSGGGQLGE
jgi:hypothetical protein